jgi:putative PIN family toxin of toxin-antitoxin system
MTERLIVDTNVLVSAFTSGDGASREVLRRLLRGQAVALVSVALHLEYVDVLSRDDVMMRCPLSNVERDALFDAFLSATQFVTVFYQWRPNLRDEGDNHVFELAVAAGDAPLVTYNIKDFESAQLKFPSLRIMTPAQWLNLPRSV